MIPKRHFFFEIFGLLYFFQIIHVSYGDLEARVDSLTTQLVELKEELNELTKFVEDFEKTVKSNIADQKLDKTIASVMLNKQVKATAYWIEVVKFTDPSALNDVVGTLIESTYLGNSDNFYYVLDFLVRNQLYEGYGMLYRELEQHNELHSGQEIFVLAHQIKLSCGTNNEVYQKMPKVVKDILAGPVILKNTDNNGYIMAAENFVHCNSNETCYSSTSSQVFVFRLQFSDRENLNTNPKAHWQFTAPSNLTKLSEGFYLQTRFDNLYLIFKQRPPGAMLRNETTIGSYHAADFRAQFFPVLIPNASPEESLLRIGLRQVMFSKMEYFFSPEFGKVNKLEFSRRPTYFNDFNGYVWEVTPVPDSEDATNDIDVGSTDARCKFSM